MDEQPPCSEDAPPCSEDAPPCSEDAPPCSEDAPPCSEDAPPCSEDAPPCPEQAPLAQEHTPPLSGATPPSQELPPRLRRCPPPSTISAPLRADLCRVFALGFLDAMKGEPISDDDEIPSDVAELLIKLSEGCIDNAASFIAEVFQENPETIYSTIYGAGYDVCAAMNAAYGPTEINLN